ncbi:MAG: lipopolysaccharide biosynthesis protein [Christensenellaceae bacterium]|jgi:O-antigen/teichoic acid export membrane protein
MGKKLSFFGSAFYYTIGVVLAQGTTFLTLMVLARLVSPDDNAMLNLYATWASVFGTIVGLQGYGSMNNARLDFGREQLDAYTSASFGLGSISLLIMMAVLLVFGDFFAVAMKFPVELLVLCLLQGFFTYSVQHIAQKYRVLNKPVPFVIWTAAVSILRLVLSVSLVWMLKERQQNDLYMGDVYGSFAANAAVGAVAVIVILFKGKVFYNRAWWKYCLAISLPFVFSGLANLVLAQSDRYMLISLATTTEAGIYSYVFTIAQVAVALWMAFNNAWSVWYYDKTHAGKSEEIVQLFKKYALFVTLLSMGLILVSPDIVRIFGGAEYSPGISITPLMMGGCYFMFLYTFPVAYESYKRKTAYIAIGTFSAAALNIIINLFSIPAWGMMGAAFSSICSYIMLFIFHYIIARFVIKGFEIPFRLLMLQGLFVLGAIALTYISLEITALRWVLLAILALASLRVYKESRHIMME